MAELDLDEHTRSEWRNLGFYYSFDEGSAIWAIRASRLGIERFCTELETYASNLAHTPISEHEHYGPYSYLKLVTWREAKITSDGIYGQLEDFRRLARIIASSLPKFDSGSPIVIDEQYSKTNEGKLVITVMNDDFDPALADPSLC